jgi:hypothetical protein
VKFHGHLRAAPIDATPSVSARLFIAE